MKNVKSAFTLSEMLITMGIIGIVAAMTVPTLISNANDQAHATQLRKFYSELSQSVDRYMSDQKVERLIESPITTKDGMDNFVRKYFKVTKTCSPKYTPCWSQDYEDLEGVETKMGSYRCNTSVTLANGIALCADSSAYNGGEADVIENQDGTTSSATNNWNSDGSYIAVFEIDVNGSEAPNIFGKDVFQLYLKNDGTIFDKAYNNSNVQSGKGAATGAFGYLIEHNWKMDY